MNPGYKTTEFWATIVLHVLSIVLLCLGQISAPWAMAVMTIVQSLYNIARGLAKQGSEAALIARGYAPTALVGSSKWTRIAPLILLVATATLFVGCKVVPGNIVSVTDSAVGAKIKGSPQGTSTLPFEVTFGVIRTTYHVVPTNTNSPSATTPAVRSSLNFTQHGFNTDINEDFETGDAATMAPASTNTVAKTAAAAKAVAPAK